jgi:hypothetical protein
MDWSVLKPEKSTLKSLSCMVRVTRDLIWEEFGPELAQHTQISFSRRMYFTLGRCWPEEKRISFNLAWVVLNRKNPGCLKSLLVHEVAHLQDPTHGIIFESFCLKYGVNPIDIPGSISLPPVAWLLCVTCGDDQGFQFSTRLTSEEVQKKFSGTLCRTCGSEVEYRELSDTGLRRVSSKIRKLRLSETRTWESLKRSTC